jgi:hypothetical protein
MAANSTEAIRFSDSQIEVLKWVAMAAMVIDHANKIVLGGEFEIMMWIGRLAFPIFAVVLAYHYQFHTRRKSRYFSRLLFFAILSQPIYLVAFSIANLNILFTLAMGFVIIWYYDYFQTAINQGDKLKIAAGLCLVAVIFAVAGNTDYYQCGVMMVPLAVLWLRHNKSIFLMLQFLMLTISNVLPIYGFSALLSYAIIGLAITMPYRIPRLPRYFYYLFYPAHMAALMAISRYLIP